MLTGDRQIAYFETTTAFLFDFKRIRLLSCSFDISLTISAYFRLIFGLEYTYRNNHYFPQVKNRIFTCGIPLNCRFSASLYCLSRFWGFLTSPTKTQVYFKIHIQYTWSSPHFWTKLSRIYP